MDGSDSHSFGTAATLENTNFSLMAPCAKEYSKIIAVSEKFRASDSNETWNIEKKGLELLRRSVRQ